MHQKTKQKKLKNTSDHWTWIYLETMLHQIFNEFFWFSIDIIKCHSWRSKRRTQFKRSWEVCVANEWKVIFCGLISVSSNYSPVLEQFRLRHYTWLYDYATVRTIIWYDMASWTLHARLCTNRAAQTHHTVEIAYRAKSLAGSESILYRRASPS